MKKICRGRVVFSLKALLVFCAAFFKGKQDRNDLIAQFESAFAEYLKVKHAIAVSSGKMALMLGLSCLEAKKGEEIIVPAYTVPEVIEIIIHLGLIPIFVDIDIETATIDTDLIVDKLTDKTRFILATHMHGNPCNMDAILELAEQHDLLIIEDAAQSCGAQYHGKMAGSFGKIGYFSFGILKNLNTLGGGMIVTDDGELMKKIRAQQQAFKPIKKILLCKRLLTAIALWIFTHPAVFTLMFYPIFYLGVNNWKNKLSLLMKTKKLDERSINNLKTRFSPEQASLGLVQLMNLDNLNEHRISKAKLLKKHLGKVHDLKIIKDQEDVKNIYLQFIVKVKNRDELREYLFKNGIDVSPGFVINCAHKQEFEEFYQNCPQSEALERENLYLPIYTPLKRNDMSRMALLITDYFNRNTDRGNV